jgi:hypothetical protein
MDWLAGAMLDPRTGALAGRNGSLAVVYRGEIELIGSDLPGLQNLVQMRLLAPAHGWLVGQGGLVRMTDDLGHSWRAPPGLLPAAVRQCDLAALAVRGAKCWLAGTPGTRVFHSADAGQTWNVFPTGSAVLFRTMTTAGPSATWVRSWLAAMAAARGSRSGSAETGRPCWESLPTPTTCRWN